MTEEFIRTFLLYFGLSMLGALVLALLMLVVVWRQVRHIDVPPDAGFAETLLYTPISVALMIDLLDFALDILAAPAAWVILDRLGLKALRGVSALEAVIPMTQAIPTMTICWLGVRLLGKNRLDRLASGKMQE